MQKISLLQPVRRASFRRLWLGMGVSYAGDRLQELAQSWLVAVVTGSALAVGGVAAVASIPQFFMPLGGVIADQVDRRKLIVRAQLAGATVSGILALMVWQKWVVVWHIYLWALVSGTIWLFARPAYKVVLTESVPYDEVRQAVSLNSITETVVMLLISTAGSVLLYKLGLAIAFVLNALSYLAAAGALWRLKDLGRPAGHTAGNPAPVGLSFRRVLSDLQDGLVYLLSQPKLLAPLLLTFSMMVAASPAFGLLASIVQDQGGSILSLGMLGAASGLGTLLGAIFGGGRSVEHDPLGAYAGFGLLAALSVAGFSLLPLGYITPLPLAVIGFVMFAQAVWNTTRIRLQAHPAYQARLQSIATMAFVVGGALGALWGGAFVDRWGVISLLWGAAALAGVSIAAWFLKRRLQ